MWQIQLDTVSLCTERHDCGKHNWTLSVSVQRDMSVVNTTGHSQSALKDMSVVNTTGHSLCT